jgi:Mannosylglycerate hydrolase MGH1-like glycoside hydrolase domain
VRSAVGLVPLFAVEVLDDRVIDRLPGFRKRMQWFLDNRKDLAKHIAYLVPQSQTAAGMSHGLHLLAIPARERLERVLKYLLDEKEFFSPHGIRSLSAIHREHPFGLKLGGQDLSVRYVPGEAGNDLFGGNSNWRGPIWFPMNYLLIEALERYHLFYGDTLKVECPTGSGRMMTLGEVAQEIGRRLTALFLPGDQGRRPCHGEEPRFIDDPNFRDLVLFYEYFHGDTGRGLGASHQTGWTALVSKLFEAESKTKSAAA